MESEDGKKLPKIIIPKIVLKFGGSSSQAAGEQAKQGTEGLRSAAAEAFLSHHPNAVEESCIGLSALLSKLSRSSRRSVENLLELCGQMSDLEKKRSLLQVLTRLRELYRRVHAICEWSKLRNEHLVARVLLEACRRAVQQSDLLFQSLRAQSDYFRAHFRTDLAAIGHAFELCSGSSSKSYFPQSLNMLGECHLHRQEELKRDGHMWIESLNSKLRVALVKASLWSRSQPLWQLNSVLDGVAVVLVHGSFEISLTLVPGSASPQWFIVKAHAESLGSAFDDSFTGLLQTQFASASVDEHDFLERLSGLCLSYMQLFFFESVRGQLVRLSARYGRPICSIAQNAEARSFELGFWFRKMPLKFSFEHGRELEAPFKPRFAEGLLQVEDDFATVEVERLFSEYISAEVLPFFAALAARNMLVYELIAPHCVSVTVLGWVKFRVAYSPFSRQARILQATESLAPAFVDSLSRLDLAGTAGAIAKLIVEGTAGHFAGAVKLSDLELLFHAAPEVCLRVSFNAEGGLTAVACRNRIRFADGLVHLEFEVLSVLVQKEDFPSNLDDFSAAVSRWTTLARESGAATSLARDLDSLGIEYTVLDRDSKEYFNLLSLPKPPSIRSLLMEQRQQGVALVIESDFRIEPRECGTVQQALLCARSHVRLFELAHVSNLSASSLRLVSFDGQSLVCRLEEADVRFVLSQDFRIVIECSALQHVDRVAELVNTENVHVYKLVCFLAEQLHKP